MDDEIARLVTTKGLAIVHKFAKQFASASNVGIDVSDFVDLGTEALMEVAPEYDLAHKAQFTTYVTPYVKGAMQDAVRRKRLELAVKDHIGQAIDREARRFSSVQPDDFEIVFDSQEVNARRYDASLSDLALALAAKAAGTVVRLLRRGTEDDLGDLEEHRVVAGVISRTVAKLPEVLQRLWDAHYVDEQPLKEWAEAEGISDATAGRHHRALKDALREVLLAEKIEGLPDVE
jgi:RNA polymerase sigma factor (sigma-70 family)